MQGNRAFFVIFSQNAIFFGNISIFLLFAVALSFFHFLRRADFRYLKRFEV